MRNLVKQIYFFLSIRQQNTGRRRWQKGLGREHIYMPASFDYEEIKQQMERLAEILEKTLVSEIIQTSEEQIETLNVLIDAQK